MRFLPAGLLAAVFAGCSDAGPAAPTPPPADRPVSLAVAPLTDALERIVPSLGSGPASLALQSALSAVLARGNPAAIQAVESALLVLEAEQPDAAVEADVIRLAIAARR